MVNEYTDNSAITFVLTERDDKLKQSHPVSVNM